MFRCGIAIYPKGFLSACRNVACWTCFVLNDASRMLYYLTLMEENPAITMLGVNKIRNTWLEPFNPAITMLGM